MHSRRRPAPWTLRHCTQTFVGSQLSVKKKKLQPCTCDEWKTGHFWEFSGTVAASFATYVLAWLQSFAAAACDGAVSALLMRPVATGLS